MPLDEVDNVMEYYFEYFSEAGVENEQYIIKELGTPQELAKKIYSDYNAMNGNENSNQQYQNGYNTTQNNGNQNNNAYQSGFYNNNYYNNTAYSTYKAPKKSIGLKIALIIMTVLASPIWLGIVIAILGVAVSVVIAVVAVAFSIGVVGVQNSDDIIKIRGNNILAMISMLSHYPIEPNTSSKLSFKDLYT